MSTRFMIFLFVFLSCLNPVWAENGETEKIVATVGSERITIADFTEELKNFSRNGDLTERMMTLTVDGRKRILDRIAKEHLLYMAAQTEEIRLDVKMEKYLERLRRNLVIKQYLNEKSAAQTISEVELKVAYNANPEKFITLEKRRVRHIVVTAKDEALKLKAQIKDTKDFAESAEKYNIDGTREKQGELGWIRPQTMVKEFSEAVFSSPLNKVSGPVKTSFGYHLILVEEIKPQINRDFSSVKDQLRKMVLASREEELINNLKKKFQVELRYEFLPQPK